MTSSEASERICAMTPPFAGAKLPSQIRKRIIAFLAQKHQPKVNQNEATQPSIKQASTPGDHYSKKKKKEVEHQIIEPQDEIPFETLCLSIQERDLCGII